MSTEPDCFPNDDGIDRAGLPDGEEGHKSGKRRVQGPVQMTPEERIVAQGGRS
ncbi:MAG: hypothetical protein ACLS7Z_10960 [Christensenellales bacterium]